MTPKTSPKSTKVAPGPLQLWRPQLSKKKLRLLKQKWPQMQPKLPQSHHQVDKMDPDLVNLWQPRVAQDSSKSNPGNRPGRKKGNSADQRTPENNWDTAVWRSQLSNYNYYHYYYYYYDYYYYYYYYYYYC